MCRSQWFGQLVDVAHRRVGAFIAGRQVAGSNCSDRMAEHDDDDGDDAVAER